MWLIQETLLFQEKQHLQALYAVTVAAGKSLHLKEVLEAALNKTLEVTNMEAGGILMVKEEELELTPMVYRNYPEGLVRDLTNRKFGKGLCGLIAQSGKLVFIPNIDGDSRVSSTAAKKEKYKTYVGFPLFAKNKVVGVMEIVDRKNRQLDNSDLELLTSIGNIIGVAIENAKLYEQSNVQSERLSKALSLLESSSSIFTSFTSSFSTVMEGIIEVGKTFLKTPFVAFVISEPEGEKLKWYKNETLDISAKTRFVLEETTKKSCMDDKVIYLNDLIKNDDRSSLRKQGFVSGIVIPMTLEQRGGFGGLIGLSNDNFEFTREDLTLFRTYANQVIIALENWGLYKREANMVIELQGLNKLIETQNNTLEHLVNIHNELTQLVLEESGFKAMTKKLAQLISNPVIVQDKFWNVVACSCCPENKHCSPLIDDNKAKQIENNPEIKEEEKLFFTKKRVTRLSPLPEYDIHEPSIIAPIVISSTVIGYITAVEKNNEIKKSDVMALEQASTVLAVEFMKQRIAYQTESKLKGDFVDDLFTGNYHREDEIIDRAHYLNCDLTTIDRVLILSFVGSKQNTKDFLKKDYFSETILREIRSIILDKYPGSLVVSKSNRIYVLLGNKNGLNELKDIKEIAKLLLIVTSKYLKDDNVNIGIGKTSNSVQNLKESYDEAVQSLLLMNYFQVRQQVVSLEDLGLMGLFLTLKDKNKLIEFANKVINPIFIYDQSHDLNLLKTLECYLKFNCNPKNTSNALYIHSNTLRYRLKRIQEISNIDLNKAEDRINTYLALQIMQILKAIKPNNSWGDIVMKSENRVN